MSPRIHCCIVGIKGFQKLEKSQVSWGPGCVGTWGPWVPQPMERPQAASQSCGQLWPEQSVMWTWVLSCPRQLPIYQSKSDPEPPRTLAVNLVCGLLTMVGGHSNPCCTLCPGPYSPCVLSVSQMDLCSRSQRLVLPETRSSGVKRTQPRCLSRVNGWSLPLHAFQAVSCSIYLILSFITFGIFIPFLPSGGKSTTYVVSFFLVGRPTGCLCPEVVTTF